MDLYRLKYKLEKNNSKIRILGKKFIENNGNKGFLIINNKKISLTEVAQIKNDKIILMLNKNIYNKTCMFKNCNLLESFSKISSDYDKESFNDMENTIVQNKNIDNKKSSSKIKSDDNMENSNNMEKIIDNSLVIKI